MCTCSDPSSTEDENMSILDYYYQLNKRDPNYSLCRATVNRGEDAGLDNTFNLSDKACMEIMNLFFTPEEQLDDEPITDYFSDDVLDSNFWLYWRTMFAFESWHSALEMKRYIQRFVHHVGGLPDFSALRFTRYNQFESLILPMVNYLKGQGVQIHLNTEVVDITFSSTPERKVATEVQTICEGADKTFHLTDDDLLFITNGSCVANSSFGSQDEPAQFNAVLEKGTGFDLWRRIARQDSAFGNPEKFIGDPEKSNWMSATVTTLDEKIVPYIESICRRDPFSGGVVTGGIVTVKDSNWLLSWTFNRQPQFRAQPGDQLCGWIYGLFTDAPGNYVKKTQRMHRQGNMHGVAVPPGRSRIADRGARREQRQHGSVHDALHHGILHAARRGDRPDVVPEGAVNFAFIGQFAENAARHHFHHRLFHAHRHGNRLHAVQRRPRRARSMGQRVRHPRCAERHHVDQGRQAHHRHVEMNPSKSSPCTRESMKIKDRPLRSAGRVRRDSARSRRRARARHRSRIPRHALDVSVKNRTPCSKGVRDEFLTR